MKQNSNNTTTVVNYVISNTTVLEILWITSKTFDIYIYASLNKFPTRVNSNMILTRGRPTTTPKAGTSNSSSETDRMIDRGMIDDISRNLPVSCQHPILYQARVQWIC